MIPPFNKFPSYRKFQEEVIAQAQASTKKVTFIDAPPGSGKSIIGMSLAYTETRSIYICTTKPLQNQLLADFPEPEAFLLMGRSNYPCVTSSIIEAQFPEVTCEDCIESGAGEDDLKVSCKKRCLYEMKKKECLSAHISILNTAYFLTECNYVGRFAGANLLCVDECDGLENAILKFISVDISERTMERLSIDPPRYKTKWECWKEWAVPLRTKLDMEIKSLKDQVKNGNIKLRRYYKHLISLYNKIEIFSERLDDTWIYQDIKGKYGTTHSFKPTWISDFAKEFFWDHGQRFILMSGTILGPGYMAKTLGLEKDQWDYIEVPNQFPVERRPVYYLPTANMTARTREVEQPKLIPAIKKIMEDYPDDKGLIHTVSYSLCQYLVNNLASKRVISHENGQNRIAALANFKGSPEPLILVSPSMDRGIDLPYDACRWIVLVKVPYGDLGDKQVSKRLYSSPFGQAWYRWMTVCSIVQMSMRGMRAADDQCDVWILDKQFSDFYGKAKDIFPNWWKDAIKLVEE